MDPVTLPCYNYFVSTLPQGWWMWGGRLTPAADPRAWGLRSSDQRNRLVVTLPVRRHLLKAVPCQDINTQNAKINVSLTKKKKRNKNKAGICLSRSSLTPERLASLPTPEPQTPRSPANPGTACETKALSVDVSLCSQRSWTSLPWTHMITLDQWWTSPRSGTFAGRPWESELQDSCPSWAHPV